jgi:hypothetical protein
MRVSLAPTFGNTRILIEHKLDSERDMPTELWL